MVVDWSKLEYLNYWWTFWTDIHCPRRHNPTDFGDLLAFLYQEVDFCLSGQLLDALPVNLGQTFMFPSG